VLYQYGVSALLAAASNGHTAAVSLLRGTCQLTLRCKLAFVRFYVFFLLLLLLLIRFLLLFYHHYYYYYDNYDYYYFNIKEKEKSKKSNDYFCVFLVLKKYTFSIL
jgi:hypothetical protein